MPYQCTVSPALYSSEYDILFHKEPTLWRFFCYIGKSYVKKLSASLSCNQFISLLSNQSLENVSVFLSTLLRSLQYIFVTARACSVNAFRDLVPSLCSSWLRKFCRFVFRRKKTQGVNRCVNMFCACVQNSDDGQNVVNSKSKLLTPPPSQ